MPQTVTLEDDVAGPARVEADAAYNGKLDALVADAVGHHIQVLAATRRLNELAGDANLTEPARLANAARAAGASRDRLRAIANILLQAAGDDLGGAADAAYEHVRRFIDYTMGSDSQAIS